MLLPQLPEGDILADNGAAAEGYAGLFEDNLVSVNVFPVETELRDAVAEHSSGTLAAVVDHHVVTGFAKPECG